MKKLYPIFTLFVIICYFATMISCKTEEPDDTTSTVITPEKSELAPYEVVAIPNELLKETNSTFEGKVDGKTINIGIDSEWIYFITPDLSNGKHDIRFTVNEVQYKIPLTIKSASNIGDADDYVSDMNDVILQSFKELRARIDDVNTSDEKKTEISKNISKYESIIVEYQYQYLKFSNSDKKKLAKMFAANLPFLMDLSSKVDQVFNINTVSSLPAATPLPDSFFEDDMNKKIMRHGKEMENVTSLIGIGAITAYLGATDPEPISKFFMGLATVAIIVRLYGKIDVLSSTLYDIFNTAIKPFELMLASKPFETNSPPNSLQGMSRSQLSVLNFTNNVEKTIPIGGNYRTMITIDASDENTGSSIKQFVNLFSTFNAKFNKLLSKFPSRLKPTLTIPALKDNYSISPRNIHGKYINILNISNPKVRLDKINQEDGTFKLKVTTDEKTDQSFSFDVVYTNTNFANNLTKKIDAVVSSAIFNFEGNWQIDVTYTDDEGKLYFRKVFFESDQFGTCKNASFTGDFKLIDNVEAKDMVVKIYQSGEYIDVNFNDGHSSITLSFTYETVKDTTFYKPANSTMDYASYVMKRS